MPGTHLHAQTIFSALDFAGIAVGSIGGALHAREHARYHYDIVGAFGLALVSALGGGVARDVLLGQGPPLALTDLRYLLVALAAAGITLAAGGQIGTRTQQAMMWVDAAAISLFAVAGTVRAENFGLHWLPAIMLGVTTAVGGGSLRDVLSGSTPRVFERGSFYAIAALAAASVYVLLDRTPLADSWVVALSALTGFTLRMASVRLGWSTRPLRISRGGTP